MHGSLRSFWRLPALAGLLYGGGYFVPWLVPVLVAFVPLLYWFDCRPSAQFRERMRGGFVFGLVMAAISLHFCFAMLDISWLAAVLYVGFALALALRIGLVMALVSWLRRRTGLPWSILLPTVWIVVDWLQTFGDLRMTGDHVAHALAAYPFLIQFADLVGHYGVSAFALAVNALIYESLLDPRPRRRRAAALAFVLLAATVLVYDGWAWTRARPSAGVLRTGVVQPNIPLAVKHDDATAAEQYGRLERLSREAASAGAALVVWPESARPNALIHWLEQPQTFAMPEVQQLAGELRTAFLVGVEYARVRTQTDYDVFNAAVLVDPHGEMGDWAAKIYLVPFAEATPFRRWLGPLVEGREGEWRWLAGGFEPGPAGDLLQVDGSRVGLLVCYEQLFPDLARRLRNSGAELQVVITNDAWFGRTPFQHFLANAVSLRAIENRSSFVRAANTGISGFVDARGVWQERTALFHEAVIVHDVALSRERTIYNRYGDFVVWAAFAALAGALALALSGRSRPAAREGGAGRAAF